jgi:hypothetical protein
MRTCGLDAFLFLRYLTVILKILLPITFIVTPTLGCLNYFSGERSLTTSFDQLSITNVASTHVAKRMWAHWTVCIIVVIWICYVLHHEILAFVKARHTYLRSRVGSTNAHPIIFPRTKAIDKISLFTTLEAFLHRPEGIRSVYSRCACRHS